MDFDPEKPRFSIVECGGLFTAVEWRGIGDSLRRVWIGPQRSDWHAARSDRVVREMAYEWQNCLGRGTNQKG